MFIQMSTGGAIGGSANPYMDMYSGNYTIENPF